MLNRFILLALCLLFPFNILAVLPSEIDHSILLDNTLATKLIVTQDGQAPNKVAIDKGATYPVECLWVELDKLQFAIDNHIVTPQTTDTIYATEFYLAKVGQHINGELFCQTDSPIPAPVNGSAMIRPNALIFGPGIATQHVKTFTVIADHGTTMTIIWEKLPQKN